MFSSSFCTVDPLFCRRPKAILMEACFSRSSRGENTPNNNPCLRKRLGFALGIAKICKKYRIIDGTYHTGQNQLLISMANYNTGGIHRKNN